MAVYTETKTYRTKAHMGMIDITDIPGVGEGDEVTVFAAEPGNDLETMARVLDTISYDIMTSVSGRVKRISPQE